MIGLSEQKMVNRLDGRGNCWVSCGSSYLLSSAGISMRTTNWNSILPEDYNFFFFFMIPVLDSGRNNES
jgi:hypothetical protein